MRIDANLTIGRNRKMQIFLWKVTMIVLVPGYRYIFATNKCDERQIIGKVTVIEKQHRRSHDLFRTTFEARIIIAHS